MTLSTALVLETHNLQGGGAGSASVVDGVERLLMHLGAQSRALSTLREVVITHPGIGPLEQARLEAAAQRRLTFVLLCSGEDYYQAKNAGFDATTADVVAFGDTDCWPEKDWLQQLFAPFETYASTVQVVAGRTTYRRDLLGTAASTIDFMYFPSPLGTQCTRNFYANNVAFRRQLFARHRFLPADQVYRGHCQVLGLKLQAQGVPVLFVPQARTIHRFPDTAREFVKLRLLRGQDTTELTPHLARSYLPTSLVRLASKGPLGPLAVLGVRLVCSVASIGRQDMPPVGGASWLACVGGIAGISLMDAAGALKRVLGPPEDRAHLGALSYHQNADHLA